MKSRCLKVLPLLLAGTLQVMPLMRSMLPVATGLAPSGGGIIFRWVVGAAALLGFDAVSSASSIAISPPNATVGQPYVGTVTYSGGHAGSVSSMSMNGICLGSPTAFLPGMTIVYNGGNTATVSGTPTGATNYSFTLRIFDTSGCGGGGNTDTRSTTLVVGSPGGGGTAPVFNIAPQSITAQQGADALLSAAASGSPVPTYSWKQGLTPIPGATTSTLDFPSVQLTNAGLYTVTASNASGSASATCYLSVCITPGTNQLAFNFTNFYPAGKALTIYSYLTNAPAGSNAYKWQYNFVDITTYSTNGNTLNLTAAQVTAAKSGNYAVVFNSVVGPTVVVNQQQYYSYWSFGTNPAISLQPQNTNVAAGADAAFDVSATVAMTGNQFSTNQPLHFDWYFNHTNLLSSHDGVGTNQSFNLLLHAVSAANAGTYTAVVTNFWGSVTSTPAVLTVASSGSSPTITSEPLPQSVLLGQHANFIVTANGTAPLSYQWQKDGVNLSDGGGIAGATTSSLSLAAVVPNSAGNYSVTITNAAGTTNSSPAALAVAAPPGLSSGSLAAGALQLKATTIPGLTYVVETASNIAPPAAWSPVATNIVPPSGVLLFTNSPVNGDQFFRLRFP